MKIGYIYYTFYPVSGGASVHGYNLARELHKLGYKLYKLNGDPDPFTKKMRNSVTGFFRILANCDVIYIRMDYFLNFRNLTSVFALFSGKKIIVEINSPSDELHLFGRGKTWIRFTDRVMATILKRVDAVITVSEPLKEFCTKALKLKNVAVIENGGEVFDTPEKDISESVKERMADIRQKYSKIIVWSGSLNEMQDLSQIEKIAGSQAGKAAVILIVKEGLKPEISPEPQENVFVFKDLLRKDVRYIISRSDIGLAFYGDYHWSRWGFYNSSLKIFEYLNNGLLAITNTRGTEIQRNYPNFRFAKSTNEVIRWIETYSPRKFVPEQLRTWSDVAIETSQIIQKVVSR